MKPEKNGTRNADRLQKISAEIGALEKQADAKAMSRLVELFGHEVWQVRKMASLALVRINSAAGQVLDHLDGSLKKEKFRNEDEVYWSIQVASGIRTGAASYLISWASDENFPKNYKPFLVKSLARVNDSTSVSFLIQSLSDENWIVRKEAASVLMTFGRNIIPQLQSSFSNENVEIRTWIARIIGQILGKDALAFFKNMLTSDRREMRYYAICALAEIKDVTAISTIVSKLSDPSWLVRVQVADVLEKIGADALPFLKKLLVEGNSDEKFYAIRIIQKIARDRAFSFVRDSLNLDDGESKVLSLSALADTSDDSVFGLLCDSLTDPNHLIQRHAANLILQISPQAFPKIVEAFKKTQNETLRYWLIEVLNSYANRAESFEYIRSIFADASKREKIQIMQSVSATDDERFDMKLCRFLLSALLDSGYSVRNCAFNQLVKFGYLKIRHAGEYVSLNDALLKIQDYGIEDADNEYAAELVRANCGEDEAPAAAAVKQDFFQQAIRQFAPPAAHQTAPAYPAAAAQVPDEFLEMSEYPVAIDDILKRAIEMKASDVHIAVNYPPSFRINGEVEFQEGYQKLTPGNTRHLAYQILKPHVRSQFESLKELDLSYEIPGVARFRVNMFMDMHGIGVVFRIIPMDVPDIDELGVPEILKAFADKQKGLVLVTGPTGSGKSTTLAAMINYINRRKKAHIITIEDPVEFVHKPIMSKITQRELHVSTKSFANALRAALREDPDIILVGEMRDLETIELAITAAETGHLVFGTVHTSSAANTIDRIIDAFPADKHAQVRISLVEGLIAIVAQSLVLRKSGAGRIAAFEIMTMTPAIGNLIKDGKTSQIKDYMLAGKQYGMQILDDSLAELMSRDEITFDEALAASYNKEDFKKRYGGSQAAQAQQQSQARQGFKKDAFDGPDMNSDSLYGMKAKNVKPKK